MNSPHQREQLPDLLSDALEPAERARVESHLAACAQCARELRQLQQMQRTLAALPAATPPANLRANVRAAIGQAAREDQKQSWAVAALQSKRARQAQPVGARRALPFALPARQLAWGGGVAVCAIGLILLARPSLHSDSAPQMAPVSETELAASADAQISAGATKGINGAAKAPQSKAKDQTKANSSGSINNGAADLPGSVDGLPPLPAPPLPAFPNAPRTRNPPTENKAPLPEFKAPSSEPSTAAAPKIPDRKTAVTPPQKRPDAPAPATRLAPTKPKPPAQQLRERDAALRSDAAPPNATNQGEPPQTRTQAPVASESESGIADDANRDAPALNRDAGRAASRARAQADSSSEAPAALAPSASARRVAPVAAPNSASNSASDFARAEKQKSATASDSDWAGGAVNAQLKRAGNQAPVLTLSVDLAIGDARLFLLLPEGQKLVWRGSLNATPVEIKLPDLAGVVRSGQKIRAKLEQTDGEGNPKSSTQFDLLWP